MSSSKGRIIIGKTGLVIDEVEFSKKTQRDRPVGRKY